MTNAIRFFQCILIEDAALVVLAPVLGVHWVSTNKFKLAEAIVAIVRASGRVDDEGLIRGRVCELLGTLVG